MKIALILGNQLFPYEIFSKDIEAEVIFMAEDHGLCTHFKYHKHKIILFLAAMRNYRDLLRAKGKTVIYWELETANKNLSFWEKLKKSLADYPKVNEIITYEIEDKFFENEFNEFTNDENLEARFIKGPLFLTSREEFKEYLSEVKVPFMANFYQKQRREKEILLTPRKTPIGGKWSFDESNRKKMPKDQVVPVLPSVRENQRVEEVKKLVEDLFPDHPGKSENFWLPVTREESLEWIDDFISERIEHFGAYQDAIESQTSTLFHSVLSPMINMGLITPKEVVERIVDSYEARNLPLNSVEGFIRQVIGWREFVRGIYQNYSEKQDEANFFKHERILSDSWYKGSLEIPPVDDAIKKVMDIGYLHHIERLMIISNFMLLCEIKPQVVHRWFMELFVDSSDWVMGPNVYGMGQFSDGGIFATKPYVSGSNYILKMSHYKKGPWCDIWDGLYWRFIERNKTFYLSNPRMGFAVSTLEKMNKERKELIFEAANEFLKKI